MGPWTSRVPDPRSHADPRRLLDTLRAGGWSDKDDSTPGSWFGTCSIVVGLDEGTRVEQIGHVGENMVHIVRRQGRRGDTSFRNKRGSRRASSADVEGIQVVEQRDSIAVYGFYPAFIERLRCPELRTGAVGKVVDQGKCRVEVRFQLSQMLSVRSCDRSNPCHIFTPSPYDRALDDAEIVVTNFRSHSFRAIPACSSARKGDGPTCVGGTGSVLFEEQTIVR